MYWRDSFIGHYKCIFLFVHYFYLIHSDSVIMPAVSASGRITALSFVRTAATTDQNAAK